MRYKCLDCGEVFNLSNFENFRCWKCNSDKLQKQKFNWKLFWKILNIFSSICLVIWTGTIVIIGILLVNGSLHSPIQFTNDQLLGLCLILFIMVYLRWINSHKQYNKKDDKE